MSLRFTRLTRPNIRQLQPDRRITEHGITVARLKDGDARYSVNVMVDGQRVHRVVGRESDGTTRSQAERFIEKVRTDARLGRLDLPKGRKTPLKFSDAADQYIKKLESEGGKNIENKKRHFSLHLKPFFKSQTIKTISEFTVGQHIGKRLQSGASNATINRELETLRHLFRMAVKWKWLDKPPCEIEPLKESEGRIIALTKEQAAALLKGAIEDEDTYCWLFVMFGLNTAMRHREILSSRFEHIDYERLRLHIPKAKGGAREQPITPELAEVLRKEQETADCPWVFPSPRPNSSLTGHRHRMDEPFRRAVKRAELDPALVTPHVMRHTAITNLVKSGADIPTIQKISGHKTVEMVLRYTHVHDDHIDQAIRAIGTPIPERAVNKNPDAITHRLHAVGKKPG